MRGKWDWARSSPDFRLLPTNRPRVSATPRRKPPNGRCRSNRKPSSRCCPMNHQDNERLTRVGPGTMMGNLLRHYWMPALLEEEIAEPDGVPVRLRLLGEDLVAFRDTKGRIGIIEAHCAHRRAHLFYGRNEECGLRCIYHGWKYDVDGNCVDIPSEADGGEQLKPKAKRVAYRTA